VGGSESSKLNELGLSTARIDREHLVDGFPEDAREVSDFDLAIIVMISKAEDQVDLARGQSELLSVGDNLPDVLDFHPAFSVNFKSAIIEEIVAKLFDVNIHNATASQVETHVIQVAGKVAVLDLVVAELHDVVTEEQVDLLDVQVAGVVENLTHLVEGDLAGVLLGLSIGVVGRETSLKDQVNGLNLSFKDELERVLVDLLVGGGLLGKDLVTGQEGLDRLDADWDEIGPGDVSDAILVSQGQEYTDVILLEVVGRKQFESLVELHVGELTTTGNICLLEENGEGALERRDESW